MAEFEDWLENLRTRARANQRPISHYETRFGPAELVTDPNDPTQAYYQGDDFYVSIDDDPNARAVRTGSAPSERRGYRAATRRERRIGEFAPVMRTDVDRPFRERMQDAIRNAWRDDSAGTGYGLLHDVMRGPTLGDVLYPRLFGFENPGADSRRAWLAMKRESARNLRDYEMFTQVADPPDSLEDWGADLSGGFLGYARNPLNLWGPGRTILSRALFQGGIQGGQNVVAQGYDIATGDRRDWTSGDQYLVGQDLARVYREQGREAFDAELAQIDWDLADRLAGESAKYDPLETVMVGGGGVLFSGGLETAGSVLARSLGWRGGQSNGLIERALHGVFTEPYIRNATRAQVRASGDPALDELLKLPNGDLDPRTIPVQEAFAQTDPWLREMAPVVERAGFAQTFEARASAYAEATVRLLEANEFGADPMAFARAIRSGRESGALPNLKAFDALETLATDIAAGRLAADELGPVSRQLARFAALTDPLAARIKTKRATQTFRAALQDADQRLTAERAAEFDAEGRAAPQDRAGAEPRPGMSEGQSQRLDAIDAAKEKLAAAEARTQAFLEEHADDLAGHDIEDIANGRFGDDGDPTVQMEAERLLNEERLAREDLERVYASEIPVDGAPYVDPNTPPEGAATPPRRGAPAGWGARTGQKAGLGAGGAAMAPQARMKQYRTPVPRQTFLRRQARNVRRRGVATYVSDIVARGYTAIIEAQHPLVMAQKALIEEIEDLAGVRVDLRPSENAALLARLSRDGYSAGHLDLTDGVRPYRQPGVKSSPSFRDAIETGIGGKEWSDARIGDFEDYLIARRAVKAWARYEAGDLERPPHAMSRLDLEDAVRAFEQDNPGFADGATKLYQFLEAHWQKKRDAGLITQEQFDQGLARNEDYVPFQRDMDDTAADPSRGAEREDAPATSGGRTNKRKAFQRFRGSDRKILSPLSTIMADVYATADRIARNDTYRAFVDLAGRAGDFGELIAKEVPRAMRRTMIDVADEAEAAARAAGASVQDAQALRGTIDALLNGDTSRAIYRAGDVIEGGRKIIYVWRDGERSAWELTDPEFADDLFKAMTGLTTEGRDLFLDFVAVPTQAIRTAITTWPGFQAANIVRDSVSAWMVTDLGFKPGESLTHGVAPVLLQDDMAKLYNAVGTQGGGTVRAALPRSRVERDLPALRGKVLRMRNLDPVQGLATVWRGFETATELSENATRIRLFARAYERARQNGHSDYDAALWAAYESRDYLDFQRTGSRMLNARRVVLFLNAALQGLDRTVRTMTVEGDPKLLIKPLVNLWEGKTRWAEMTGDERYQVGRAWKYWAKLNVVGMFGLMLTALYADDEDYQYGFSDYLKNNYWLVRAGNYWISIPKPFEHAVVSNIFERAYEGTYGNDPLAWGRLVRGMGDTYLPPTEVTAAVVPLQLAMNRTATGAPIVPEGLEDLDPHLQYTAMTSSIAVEFANGLSEHAGIEVSPAQLDHVFGGVAGEFYRAPARALAGGDAPALAAPDIPVLNRFLREPGRGGTPVRTNFYDTVMRQSGALNRAAGTLGELVDRGDMQAAEDFLAERAPWERDYAMLRVGFNTDANRLHPMTRARNVVTEIGRIRRELNGARPLASETLYLPDLTPRQRREALSALDDVSAAEMQAALVMAGAPGFEGRPEMDVNARYERLRAIAPGVAALLRARLVSGTNKAIDFDTVRRLWPEARARLASDGFRADLSDLTSQGEADFAAAVLRQLDLEAAGGSAAPAAQQRQERAEELDRIGAP